ncbi:MAG: alpha-amylase [Firmicutes bacterium]|nr:alpha-amylase [Bacillota bacterium]
MAWYDEAIFYHIYPLGLLGAPKKNEYGQPVHRLKELDPWIDHVLKIGATAIYIGPLFESVGHGYETTDYKKLDSRLGTNEDLKEFVKKCHDKGVRVIFDGVFNHTGRDFFAFQDIKHNREKSRYKDWYLNVNFWGNNEYNDGFSYANWGGYDLLVKLNQHNQEVKDYISDVIRFWVSEFDIDGIRLDAADVLDFNYMQALRQTANEVKPDFWLMGEVIHGEYSRWANENTLHSVTNYHLHKALYSGHNDHNYFEIAHTVRRLDNMGKLKLYNFVDNHDVERIYTKLNNKDHFLPTHILLYTLPGIPSLYYGSEFGIEGRKERYSDDSIRPALKLDDYKDAYTKNTCIQIVSALGKIRQNVPALSYGDYKELSLTTRQYAFSRTLDGTSVIVTVNNDDNAAHYSVSANGNYVGALSGERVTANGKLEVNVPANSGEIWLPEHCLGDWQTKTGVREKIEKSKPVPVVKKGEKPEPVKAQSVPAQQKTLVQVPNKPYEQMSVEELQAAVLQKLAKNGPVTDQMRRDVANNVYHDSLVNWVKSFR